MIWRKLGFTLLEADLGNSERLNVHSQALTGILITLRPQTFFGQACSRQKSHFAETLGSAMTKLARSWVAVGSLCR